MRAGVGARINQKIRSQRKLAHKPVLLRETIDALSPKPGMFIVDGTLGEGGHASEIIKKISPGGRFLGIDWDDSAVERFRKNANSGGLKSVTAICGNYADTPGILNKLNVGKADGFLLDLGFSSVHLESKRGFSFGSRSGADEPLIMTYSNTRTPAYAALARMSKQEIEDMIRDLSDERYAKSIASAIWERERKKTITMNGELAEVIRSAVPKGYERGRIDPATRTFMALRIYINDELGNLSEILSNLGTVLKSGGRAVVISFHSHEDRLVKNAFRDMAKDGLAKLITKKLIVPTEEEVKENPRSRSAKLRAIEIN